MMPGVFSLALALVAALAIIAYALVARHEGLWSSASGLLWVAVVAVLAAAKVAP